MIIYHTLILIGVIRVGHNVLLEKPKPIVEPPKIQDEKCIEGEIS